MQTLIRLIAICVIGSSFIAFTAMKAGAVDMPVPAAVPAQFPAPGNPGFPAPVPPIPNPRFPGPGGTGNAAGATGYGLGGVPGGGTGGMSSSGIH